MLKEAKRLYDFGLAVHWLRPNSKAPVKNGWSKPTREPWNKVQKEYVEGYGLGILLGQPSKVGEFYAAVIDLDIRSNEKRYFEEATSVIRTRFPRILETAAQVATGRGFGSSHFYIVTKEPVPSTNIASSTELVKVYSPTTGISRIQLEAVKKGTLFDSELEKGFRLKRAWEVDFMSTGKQVVAPPTVHPDTKIPYKWKRELQ